MADLAKFIEWLRNPDTDIDRFKDTGIPNWGTHQVLACLNFAVSECLEPGEQYLEIGTWMGGSLLGALDNNDARAHVIDPLHHATTKGPVFDDFVKNTASIQDRFTLHRMFAQYFNEELPPIGVFYYDGDHDSGHTYEGLTRFQKSLADRTIIIVDDYLIHGGSGQHPFPGHKLDPVHPVKTDVDRWVQENHHNITLYDTRAELHGQAVILFERSK